ncbi:MAG: hypothetical protein F6K35_43365 [Okeania sp. SIO2H7]|nr:hypothetical protein [Okeania sp. SIO2H7]
MTQQIARRTLVDSLQYSIASSYAELDLSKFLLSISCHSSIALLFFHEFDAIAFYFIFI